MNVRDVLGFVLIPLVLYLAAQGLRGFGAGGGGWGFDGVAELGVLIAISLMIVGGTCLLFQLPPSQWPARGMIVILFGSLIAATLAALLQVDLWMESGDRGHKGSPFRTLIEFAVILCSLFVAPRLGKPRNPPDNTARSPRPPAEPFNSARS